MIKGLRVVGFKKLHDVTAEFEPFNVLIGPNGVGKSSMLQAIDFLHGLVSSSIEAHLKDQPYNYDDLPSLNQRNKLMSWLVMLDLPRTAIGQDMRAAYFVEVGRKRYPYVSWEGLHKETSQDPHKQELLFVRKGRRSRILNRRTGKDDPLATARLPASILSQLEDDQAYPEAVRVRDFFLGIRSYLLWDAKTLRKPSDAVNAPLGRDGQNLASFLKMLQLKHPQQWSMLVRTVRSFVPILRDIRILGPERGYKSIEVVEAGARRNYVYNHNQISDGILRVLAIASLRFMPDPPTVICLEEPENGVHPQLLGNLIGLLKQLTKRKDSPTQVFIATHSPYVLDHFVEEPECVQVMESNGGDKGARLTKLSTRKDLRLARRTLSKSLGELWYSGILGGGAKD